jgi:hypothetical protein
MQRRWMFAAIPAMLVASQMNLLGDWKSALARKAVGRAARAGIEEAVEHVVRDATFDAALVAVSRKVEEAEWREEFGSTASEAFEAAMTAADIASALDKASDVADAAKKINKVRKVIKRLR